MAIDEKEQLPEDAFRKSQDEFWARLIQGQANAIVRLYGETALDRLARMQAHCDAYGAADSRA